MIITSPYFKTDSADLVARNAGCKVVTLATSVGANDSINTYYDLFDFNVAQIVKVLQ